jgi:tripartite-type tricarboxylate transporter receptor subunit TctC
LLSTGPRLAIDANCASAHCELLNKLLVESCTEARLTAVGLNGQTIMQQLARICAVAITAITAASVPGPSRAQDYPSKPIRLIVVTAAGGLMDVAARILADRLDKSLGQRLVIENRSGSGGNIGAEAVAKSDPDGYTLGLVQIGNVAINPHVYTDMTFDPLVDLVPVAPVTSSAILVVANSKVPATNLTELIALAKKEPGKLSYGSGGNGTAPHLAGEMFKAAAGVNILHVPYRGAGPAVNDTVGGHVQLTFVGLGAVRSGVDAGMLKILAVAQSQRLKSAPQFLTSAEAGLPGYEFVTWFGVVAPKGTPSPVVNTLVKHIHAMQDDPSVQQRMAAGGLEPLKETPEQFGARMRRDQDRLRDIVKAAKLKPD